MNQVEKIKFNIKRKFHPDQKVKFLNVSDIDKTQGKLFLCNDCMTKGQVIGKFVNIKSVIKAKNENIVNNWPFFKDDAILNIIQRESDKPDIHLQIVKQFDKFKEQINSIIDDHKKKLLVFFDKQQDKQIFEYVLKKSMIKELNELLIKSNTYEQAEFQLKDLISQCHQEFQKLEKDLNLQKLVLEKNEKMLQSVECLQSNIIKDLTYEINNLDDINSSKTHFDQLKFEITNIKNAQLYGKIIQNQYITLQFEKNQISQTQIVSNFVLKKDQKYILRLEIHADPNFYSPMIGLIQKKSRNSKFILDENLCYYQFGNGVKNIIKGQSLYAFKPNEIEMYISISENQLLVTDYPHHISIHSLENNNNNLQVCEELQIGFSTGNKQYDVSYVIKEFYVVHTKPAW